MDIVLSAVMLVSVLFADPEGDGSYNYLLVQKHGANQREYMIAHSYPSDMHLQVGTTLLVGVKAKCSLAWSLDPVPKALEEAQPWGSPRRAYICNADSILIEGKEYKSLVRSNNE